jgi:hypothetical protein
MCTVVVSTNQRNLLHSCFSPKALVAGSSEIIIPIKFANILVESTEDGCIRFIRTAGRLRPDYMTSHPRRQQSSCYTVCLVFLNLHINCTGGCLQKRYGIPVPAIQIVWYIIFQISEGKHIQSLINKFLK